MLNIGFPIVVAGGGALFDLAASKIDNWWTLGNLAFGLILALLRGGAAGLLSALAGAALPLLLLWGLYRLRMLGAGDIKLFMALGTSLGTRGILRCIGAAFLLGAIYSFVSLLLTGALFRRLRALAAYARECLTWRKLLPYREDEGREGTFPFAVAILGAVLLKAGGVY